METEEFEFRPITEGLGFHRKQAPTKSDKGADKSMVLDSIKSPIQQAASLSAQLGLDEEIVSSPAPASTLESLRSDKPKKTPWGEPIMRKPLPRQNDAKGSSPVHSTLAVSSAVARAANAFAEGPTVTETVRQTPSMGIEAVVKSKSMEIFSWSAAFVDGVMVLALSLIFLVSLLIVTEVDLMTLLAQPDLNIMAWVALASVFLAVAQIYMIGARGWAGATLGDWAFDVEVGNYLERSRITFPLKLVWRSLIYTVTGFVLLPVLSTLLGRDVMGRLTGLTLQTRG